MSKDVTNTAAFDLIRYANCWEDPVVLLQGLSPKAGGQILSIGSAGDNSFSLLLTDPKLLVAVDVSEMQLYLIELKKAAIANLEYEELLAFLGFRHGVDRAAIFGKLKMFLPEGSRQYWEQHLSDVQEGIIHKGKFESYFRFFAKRIMPFIHSRKTVETLLKAKTAEEQVDFYNRKWNSLRWRLLFRLFFSKYVLGRYGRDPEFLKQVKVPVGKTIFEQAARHLQSKAAQGNAMLRYNLTGDFGEALPHYLQPTHYDLIRQRLDRLVTFKGYAQDAVQAFGTFDAMNLSNIFEYMDPEQFRLTAGALTKGLVTGGRMAYWNLMVPRSVAEECPENMQHLEVLSQQLSREDNGFYYRKFIVDTKV